MIKPDYITFSQETFDECEELRHQLLAKPGFEHTKEYQTRAIKLSNVILGSEYGRYLDSLPRHE